MLRMPAEEQLLAAAVVVRDAVRVVAVSVVSAS
jgi:hypothetical protein